ncbi:MAG: PaaI family thioesterase [Deltaproteobacteria bacterium]|nr:PaaI family thioesterase [Deltaproteobacteria bacterium]
MSKKCDPDLSPEEGWTEVQLVQTLLGCRSFVSDDPHGDGDRLKIKYYLRDTDKEIVGRVWFGPGAEGPPGHAHGGSMAAVLDESMGAAVWAAGYTVLTGDLAVKYLRPLPLETTVIMETWLEDADGRKVVAGGHLIDNNGKPYCEGRCTFVELSHERFSGGRMGDLPGFLQLGKISRNSK